MTVEGRFSLDTNILVYARPRSRASGPERGAFIEGLAAARALKLDDPKDPGTDLGPPHEGRRAPFAEDLDREFRAAGDSRRRCS